MRLCRIEAMAPLMVAGCLLGQEQLEAWREEGHPGGAFDTGEARAEQDGPDADADVDADGDVDSDTDAVGDDDDDSGTGAPVGLTAVLAGCESDSWVYRGITDGLFSGAVANAWEVLPGGAGWDEEHSLEVTEYASDGSSDTWETILEDGVAPADLDEDANTVFACGTHDTSAVMVYAIRLYDAAGLYSCAIWGDDDAKVDAVLATPDGGGDVTGYNTTSNPGEFSGCGKF